MHRALQLIHVMIGVFHNFHGWNYSSQEHPPMDSQFIAKAIICQKTLKTSSRIGSQILSLPLSLSLFPPSSPYRPTEPTPSKFSLFIPPLLRLDQHRQIMTF